LYALSSAESYYLLQGFVFLTDNDGNVVTQGRLKAMVWYNPAFKLDDYFESDGLHRLSELNVPSSDYKLNRAINDKLTLENIVEIWVELANHSIVSQESRQNQEIVDAIEASPEILNNPEVLNYIQDTQPEQYKIMTPQISEIKKRARSSSRTSSDDEEPIIYGKPDTNRPSRRRFIVESDDEEDQKGGSRRRKRTKKTKKAKRKYKKNKRTYKR
jgi:phage terminase small subunit